MIKELIKNEEHYNKLIELAKNNTICGIKIGELEKEDLLFTIGNLVEHEQYLKESFSNYRSIMNDRRL